MAYFENLPEEIVLIKYNVIKYLILLKTQSTTDIAKVLVLWFTNVLLFTQ